MNKKVVFLIIMLMFTVSLSGCLGRGGGRGDGDENMGSPEEVNADDYNVLYIGHSFGQNICTDIGRLCTHCRFLRSFTIH